MKFSKYFIDRPISITLIVIAISIIGVFSYLKLSVSDLPSVDYPVLTVNAFYPGADPQIISDIVANPLEQQLIGIQGLKNIISVSTDSFTRIILTFDLNCNLDSVIPDVQKAISYAKGYMPLLPDDPTITKTNPSEKPVMFFVTDSETIPHDILFQIVDKKLVRPISMTEGISSATIWSVSSAIRIYLDPQKMAKYGITLSDISMAISNSSALCSGGFLSSECRTFSLVPKGQLTTPREYNNLIVKYENNNPVRISDIGIAKYTSEQTNYMLNYFNNIKNKNYVNPVMVSISRKNGSNTISLLDGIKTKINKLKTALPKALNLSVVYDRSLSIISSINEVKITLIAAIFLVVFIIYFILGNFSATLIPGIIIPITLLGNFIVMYFFNYSIDSLSVLALILAVGFIVDDAIVVLENTSRHIENGLTAYDAALKSSNEITKSVLSMTLSLVIVFVPILFLGDMVGRIFREFAIVTIVVILISGILSLTLTPMMCANILSPNKKRKKNYLQRFINFFLKKAMKKYSKYLLFFLRNPSMSLLLWCLCIAFALFFYFIVPKNFLPNGDSGTIFGSIQVPIGVSSDRMQKFQHAIDDILNKDKNIAKFFTVTGESLGADQSSGRLVIILKDREKRESMSNVLAELRRKFAAMPFNLGSLYLAPMPILDINTGGETTASDGALYSYLITGLNRDEVYKYAQLFENKLKKLPGFTDVQSDIKLNMPQLTINILRDKASSLGINTIDIENALLNAYSQGRIAQYIKNTSFYDVIIELAKNYSSLPEDLSSIYLRSNISGKMIPLSAVVELKQTSGPQSVTRYQELNAATISFNLANGVSMGTAVSKLNELSHDILPTNIDGKLQGRAKQFAISMHNLLLLILCAVFLMYIVLGIMYENYLHPITVLTTLPVAVVGALGALLLFHSELSLFAYVGLFLLLGIIAKNGIMILDMALQKISVEKKTPIEAIYSSCLIRFRPILMTGLTSIFGAIPLVIGIGVDSSLRRPLGIVILGGLILSQILTLFVTPGIFLLLNKLQYPNHKYQ